MQDFAHLFAKLSLKTICLLSCRLGSLPHALTYHCSLESLAVRDCFLTTLPLGPYLDQLKTLDLCGNEFWTVPSSALEAPLLESVSMIGMLFMTFPKSGLLYYSLCEHQKLC